MSDLTLRDNSKKLFGSQRDGFSNNFNFAAAAQDRNILQTRPTDDTVHSGATNWFLEFIFDFVTRVINMRSLKKRL